MKTLAVALLAALGVTAAHAAPVTYEHIVADDPISGYVSSITYNSNIVSAGRGRGDSRHLAKHAFGEADGKFFEIGLFGHVDFHFNPGFISGGTVYEVTFGTRKTWPEYATVKVGNKGDDSSFVEINENPIDNQSASFSFTFEGGPFDTIRLKNAEGSRVSTCRDYDRNAYDCGGFDVDASSVTPVPLPASVLLLGAGLGGLAAMRRRKQRG